MTNTLFRYCNMLKSNLDYLKKDYISILQSFLSVSLENQNSANSDNISLSNFSISSTSNLLSQQSSARNLKLFGGDKHKRRLKSLLEECREKDPTLPSWESLVGEGTFVDKYGFKYDKSNESNLFHYVCHQLNMFFDNHLNHVEEKFWKNKIKEWRTNFVITVSLKLR